MLAIKAPFPVGIVTLTTHAKGQLSQSEKSSSWIETPLSGERTVQQ